MIERGLSLEEGFLTTCFFDGLRLTFCLILGISGVKVFHREVNDEG